MAESAEHQFLSAAVSRTLQRMSNTELYAYTEAERRKFDFACELKRDWSRPLVGQTLWHHTAGVDKDLRTMLLDEDAEICVYVARDTVKGRRLLSEAMRDFRSGAQISPHRLRVIWVPQDFDADDERQRDFVEAYLREAVGRDVLLNVVLGNLAAEDVRFFVRTSGLPGLHLALLERISTSTNPHLRATDLAKSLGVSSSSVRERLLRLLGCGMVSQFGGGATLTRATTKGRVFLDFCRGIKVQTLGGSVLSSEWSQLLRLLEMRYAPSAVTSSANALHLAGPMLTEVPEMVTGRLLATISAAETQWGTNLDKLSHIVFDLADTFRGTVILDVIEKLQAESGRFMQ